jgi:hypothetical protein
MNRSKSNRIERRARRLSVSAVLLSLAAYLTFAYATTIGKDTLGVEAGGILAGIIAVVALTMAFRGFLSWNSHWKSHEGNA